MRAGAAYDAVETGKSFARTSDGECFGLTRGATGRIESLEIDLVPLGVDGDKDGLSGGRPAQPLGHDRKCRDADGGFAERKRQAASGRR